MDYDPSETAVEQAPIHNARKELDPKETSAPDPIPIEERTPEHHGKSTGSTSFDSDFSNPCFTALPLHPPLFWNTSLLRTKQVNPSAVLVVRVISNNSTTTPTKYIRQLTNNVTRSDITDKRISS